MRRGSLIIVRSCYCTEPGVPRRKAAKLRSLSCGATTALQLPRTTLTSLQSCQGRNHVELLRWYVLVRLQGSTANLSGSLYFYHPCIDGLHCCIRRSVQVCSTTTVKVGDSNVTGNFINAMREFAAMKGQFRPTEDMENAGGHGRTRAGALCLLRTTLCREYTAKSR